MLGNSTGTENAVYLTVAEAADYLRFSKSTIYRLSCEGKIPFFKAGLKHNLYRPADLDDYLERIEKHGRDNRSSMFPVQGTTAP